MTWQLLGDLLAINAVVWVFLLWLFWSESRAEKARTRRANRKGCDKCDAIARADFDRHAEDTLRMLGERGKS